MATSGRTVLFSAVTVALSMSATVAVPDVLPEVVCLRRRGHRGFRRHRVHRGDPGRDRAAGSAAGRAERPQAGLGCRAARIRVHKPVEELFWYRSSKFVMRRWAPIGLAVIALLLLLGLPFSSVKWGFPDDRVLPRSASSHQVGDQLRNGFAHDSADGGARRHPGRPRPEPGGSRQVRRRPVAGARRVGGIGARRDIRGRKPGGAAGRRPPGWPTAARS